MIMSISSWGSMSVKVNGITSNDSTTVIPWGNILVSHIKGSKGQLVSLLSPPTAFYPAHSI